MLSDCRDCLKNELEVYNELSKGKVFRLGLLPEALELLEEAGFELHLCEHGEIVMIDELFEDLQAQTVLVAVLLLPQLLGFMLFLLLLFLLSFLHLTTLVLG